MTRKFGPIPVPDLLIAIALFAFTAATCVRSVTWDPSVYHSRNATDIWFDADLARIFWLEVDIETDAHRTMLHPLQRALSYPPVFVLRKVAGLSGENATHVFHALLGGLWCALYFFLLRWARFPRPDAVIFTTVAATSAGGFFWLPILESFIPGSISMMPALAIAARPETARTVHHYAAVVVSLAMTVTNVMVSFFTSLALLPRLRLLGVLAAAGATVAALAGLDFAVFPETNVFISRPSEESAWVFTPESGGPFAILRVFFVSAVVAPEIRFLDNWLHPAFPVLTFQFGELFSGGAWSYVATPAWAFLLGLGIWGLWREKTQTALRTVLTLTLLYTLLLHLVYGRETFLYAGHFVPLLVMVAAFSARTSLRKPVLALALLLIVSNVFNNIPLFRFASAYSARHAAIKKTDGLLRYPSTGKTKVDLSLRYRFWRDVLGMAPPLGPGPIESLMLRERKE